MLQPFQGRRSVLHDTPNEDCTVWDICKYIIYCRAYIGNDDGDCCTLHPLCLGIVGRLGSTRIARFQPCTHATSDANLPPARTDELLYYKRQFLVFAAARHQRQNSIQPTSGI